MNNYWSINSKACQVSALNNLDACGRMPLQHGDIESANTWGWILSMVYYSSPQLEFTGLPSAQLLDLKKTQKHKTRPKRPPHGLQATCYPSPSACFFTSPSQLLWRGVAQCHPPRRLWRDWPKASVSARQQTRPLAVGTTSNHLVGPIGGYRYIYYIYTAREPKQTPALVLAMGVSVCFCVFPTRHMADMFFFSFVFLIIIFLFLPAEAPWTEFSTTFHS